VTEIVLEVVALGLECIEALVLDFPSGAAASGKLDDGAESTGRSVTKLLR